MANRIRLQPPADIPKESPHGRFLRKLCEYINREAHGEVGGASTFEDDGTLVATDAATCWKDENFSGAQTAIGASAPSLVSWDSTSILIPQFQNNLTKELNLLREYDHAGVSGGSLQIHAHLFPTTAGAGTVKLKVEYIIKRGTAAKVTATAAGTATMTGTAWDEIKLNIGDPITSALLQQGTQIGMRLYRDSTDPGTYADPVAISTWGWHYEVDMLGSRQITTK